MEEAKQAIDNLLRSPDGSPSREEKPERSGDPDQNDNASMMEEDDDDEEEEEELQLPQFVSSSSCRSSSLGAGGRQSVMVRSIFMVFCGCHL